MPFGAEPFGGDVPFGIESAIAIRENAIRVRFTIAPRWSAVGVAGDAADPRNYVVLNDPSTTGLDGAAARPVFPAMVQLPEEPDGRTVELIVDRPMTPWPAVYAVSTVGVLGAGGETSEECALSFHGAYRQLVPKIKAIASGGKDLANPQTVEGLPLGVVAGGLAVAGDGDYGVEGPESATKSRLIRRLLAMVNGYAHIPDFGLGAMEEVKRLATSGRLADLAARAETQLMRDPDVLQARVRITPRGAGTFTFAAVVRTRSGPALRLDVPFST